jgi:glycosyltransferase involved in cell wall biosynthesis
VGVTNDVAAVVLRAEVLVLPSRAEAVGLALLEAMACATPIVASDVGGIPEMLENVPKSCYRLVEPGNPEALSFAIADLIAHRPPVDDLIAMSEVARAQYSSRRFEGLIRDMVVGRAAQRLVQSRQ